MEVSIKVDLEPVIKQLGELPKQVRYATSVAQNRVIKKAQAAALEHIKQAFHVRKEAFFKRSIKVIKWSNKADLETILSVEDLSKGSGALLRQFETGGQHKGNTGRLAVPSTFIRPTVSSVITRSKFPRSLKRSALITLKSGAQAIIQTKGRGKNTKSHIAYFLKRAVPIDARLSFYSVTSKSIQTHFQQEFAKAYQEATASAN